MATGDTADFLARVKAQLPAGWLGASTPNADAIFTGIADMFAWTYAMLVFVKAQTRVSSSTGLWLDSKASDFFGGNLPRFVGENDTAYAARIKANFFLPKVTRAALYSALLALTGRAPVIFEPAQPMDTGAYDTGFLAYDTAGGYGAVDLPFQCFVTAFRPNVGGIPTVAGYDGELSTPEYVPGAYDVGAIEYVNWTGQVTDDAILDTIVQTIPEATIAWTRITN